MPKLSIITPVFNEENFIEEILKRVNSTRIFGWEKEIVIVDDGSTDKSKIKIFAFAKSDLAMADKQNFKVIAHKKNQGKGTAVKTALNYVSGDYILIQDAEEKIWGSDDPWRGGRKIF